MRILKYMLPLLLLLFWSGAAKADYDPASPPEPGVNFTLTTRAIPEDAAYILSSSGSYSFGRVIGLVTRPHDGYRFLQWEDEDGTIVSESASFDYTMPAKDVTLIARYVYDPDSPEEPSTPEFKDISAITFVANPREAGYFYWQNHGSLTDTYTDDFEVGTTHSFRAYENAYYHFVNWTRNGVVVGTEQDLEYTVPIGDHTLVANYAYDPENPSEPSQPLSYRMLTVKANPEGAATVYYEGNGEISESNKVKEGTTVYVRAYANDYYNFVNWTDDDGNVVSDSQMFYYTMPGKKRVLTANYIYNYDPSSPDEPGTPNPGGAPENMVLWPRMGMYDDTHVQILCETPGATIHYTLDGTTPNAESPVYTEPVFVPSNIVVKAIAYKEGMEDSPVVTYQVTAYKAGTPIFTFENLKLKITSSTPDAIIRYTTDFTDPTEESEVYTEPFEPEENCRIKAYASKEGLADSPINIFVFRKADYTIPAPTFTMDEDGKLVITPSVAGGVTRYTLDGTDPTASSTVYSAPLELDGNFTVKAYTTHTAYYDSPVGEYVIEGYQVETPTAVYSDLALTLATTTSSATIRYTTDGSEPTEESTAYTAPLSLTEDCKVVAKGFKPNYLPSDTISYVFVLTDHKAATPVLTYDPEALTITMVCDTVNTEIRYTIDGEVPTADTGIKYEGPIAVVGNHTYIARAFRSDLFASDAATVVVDDQKVPNPTASFANRVLTIECPDEEAQIHYTLDGEEPTDASALYEAPLALTEDCTVSFIAVREFFDDSEIGTYEFVYADHQVGAPVLTYDPDALTITMACDTVGAQIRYTIDGEAPTESTGTLYDAPVAVVGNHVYTARAFRTDLFDSEAAAVTVDDQYVTNPTATFANRHLTLACTDTVAKILYTLDGTEPTDESSAYEAPLALTEDCTVKFVAVREFFHNSEIGTYEFKYAEHQVGAPVLTYDPEALTITMACDTVGAQIRYTIDGEAPTSTTGTLYEAPVAVVGNHVYTARAFRTDLFDSEAATVTVDDQYAPNPTATFANRHLTLACADTVAKILFTLDGTEPTAESSAYEAPLALTEDCTVKFVAVRPFFHNSEIGTYEFKVSDHQVAAPVLTYNRDALTVAIACPTENAVIRYTIDGEAPTENTGTVYEGPVAVTGNHVYRARAFRSDLFDSELATQSVNDLKVVTPTAAYANKQLTLACSDFEAHVFYTLDGTDPSDESTLYETPLPMTADCTVKFIAVREFYHDSEIGTYEFKVDEHRVAAPVVSHSIETMKATMTTATQGAQIRYSTDGTVPTDSTGTVYTAPVDLTGNITFTVRAFHPQYFDSEVVVYEINNMKLPTPTATYGRRALTIACEDTTAQIRYTVDGTAPTAASTLYSAPIALTADCTVRFIAAKAGFVSSDEGRYAFVLADHREAAPTFSRDYAGRKLTVAQAANLPVAVTIDGAEQTLATPATIDVTPDMTSISAMTIAQNEDNYDSETVTEAIVFHAAPKFSYDGHTLRVSPGDGEPAGANSTLAFSFNGQPVQATSIDITEFGTATATVSSNSAFVSEPAEMAIDAYNTGRVAAVRRGHRLKECIGTWGDKAEEYSYLRLGGELSDEDLRTVGALPQLTILHIEADTMANGNYSRVLAGSRIETLFCNQCPEGMLIGMPRLTTLMWGRTDRDISNGRIAEAGNPNILFWTPRSGQTSNEYRNTVEYTYAPDGIPTDPEGEGVFGRNAVIQLYDGYPFNAHMPLAASYISFRKTFSLPTEIDVCAGWETIVLPFTPQTITHERAGAIVPFAAWDGQNHPYEGIKPFWLYSSTEEGWEAAEGIKAGVPYIISMPNNPEYVESNNLYGEVNFWASGEIILGTEESAPQTTAWKEGSEFTGIFMPLEADDYTDGILSMNVKPTGDEYAGSAFTADSETHPFGAYVWAPGRPQSMPVFPDGNGVQLPTVADGGIMVDTPAPGTIRISSTRDVRVAIVTPDGATVRQFSLQAGESVTAEGLTPGLYIASGVKVMVR